MNDAGKPLSILVINVSRERVERFAADFGLQIGHAETYSDQAAAMAALQGQRHYDLIITSSGGPGTDEMELLRQLHSLAHRRDTPVVKLSPPAREVDIRMGKSGKAGGRRHRTPGFTEQMKELAAAALAQKVGYLKLEDFPDARLFDDLPTRSYGPHKIVRCKHDELLLVRRGLVEVWQTHHDRLVKQLMIGTLFGEIPLLGQTMVITQAVAGPAGTTIAVTNAERVRELIKANALALAEKLYPRLAAVDAEHYRVIFQPAESRLAALLLELAGEGSTVEGLTQRQLGERLRLMRETIVASVASLKAKKLIGVERRKMVIFDRKALEELSRS